jgi:DNA-binding CsgD family transcriptional regulator/tetratricopeptide (TPR) repeat protein
MVPPQSHSRRRAAPAKPRGLHPGVPGWPPGLEAPVVYGWLEMHANPEPGFLGRTSERQQLDALLTKVREGQSAVLVLHGEAGIGKTALLRYAARQASGFRVAGIAGVEAEMELPFASTHQLCAPMLARLDALTSPQRDALCVALGLSSGHAPDRFLVGLAVLSLLSAVAAERPLLCLVDDAQWLDAASSQVLGFVARRLQAESVAIAFAIRELDTRSELEGLPELRLGGLEEEDARALLARAVPGPLDDRVRDRIVAESHGNPLALLELPRTMSAAQRAGGFVLPGAGDVPRHIEDQYLRRVGDLPRETQRLMLLAAADPLGDARLVGRAAQRLGIATSALTPAERAELLEIGVGVRFRHPLVRSAVYRVASPEERRAVHLALAEETDAQLDPDRRAWHLAAAAEGPDEDVASELEHSAGRARARGGLAAAAAFLTRSLSLTRDPERQVHRALAAAQASLHAGAFDAALGLLATAETETLDELERARVDLLRGQIAAASGADREAAAQLLTAAKRLEPLDVSLARETYLDAWGAALFAGALAGSVDLLDVSRAARSAPRPVDAPHPVDLLLDGLAVLMTEGRGVAAATLKLAVSAFRGQEISVEKGLQWSVLASCASVELWDFESWDAVITRQMELAREAGALAPLSIALNGEGIVVAWSGDFPAAAGVVAEADAVTEATGTRIAPYGGMLLAALRGREAEACALIDAAIRDATASGEGLAVQYARWATAVLYNGLGGYEQALSAARQASDDAPDLFLSVWALPELVEAAIRSGRPRLAAEACERLADSANVSGTDWGLGIAARSRALLSEAEAAESCYREAIARLRRTRLRTELVRAHLLYGEWLRRENRRGDARTQLRTAHDQFTSIGMDAFAERARRELLATGEKLRKRSVESRDDLTAQERQIAQLARDGLSNPEIGARLFLSPRTVEWHLHHVFTKLGIRSRRQLARALPASDAEVLLT